MAGQLGHYEETFLGETRYILRRVTGVHPNSEIEMVHGRSPSVVTRMSVDDFKRLLKMYMRFDEKISDHE